ncbi:hypothetical protein NEMBOFW57_006523 [Staphylotrichum longicolle]|uniref:DUF7703 domain-containing protein n=1 Tax=Staphylotrichum longicolle TaxID=669026 RepID=A0AAD4ESY9_9PEZI|nr:hypothetical protein NEMBOFW57_006523 [Staphylotrichum longicolle]
MGYSGNPTTGGSDESAVIASISPAMIAFLAVSFYNVIELNVIIFSSFKRRHGLYFWSFLAATNGIPPHSIGFLLKNLLGSHTFGLYITLVSIGWVPMVTGQSLVLYSRLHLILRNPVLLRMILGMIIFNAIVLHVPIIILMYGANSSAVNSWTHPYEIYEKVQVTMFCLQELIISGVYIKTCYSFFDAEKSLYGDAVRKMRRHLLVVNIVIILLDVPILVLEYADLYDLQTVYKAFVYSVKLKMEFRILNQLMDMTHKRAREDLDLFDNSSDVRMHDRGEGVSGGSGTGRGRKGTVTSQVVNLSKGS